jgi:hypothetical protein
MSNIITHYYFIFPGSQNACASTTSSGSACSACLLQTRSQGNLILVLDCYLALIIYLYLILSCAAYSGYSIPFQVIKRRIEALIDREYLERDAENPNVYKYLA